MEEYLVDLCGARAAVRAGYSAKWARSQGSRLLRKPHIRQAIDKAMEERVKEIHIRREEVIGELKKVAMAPASDENGAAVKMGSKLRALELLGKHLGIFEGRGEEMKETVKIVEDI